MKKLILGFLALAAFVFGLVLYVPVGPSEAAQADADSYRCMAQYFYGQTDGVCIDASTYDVHFYSNDNSRMELTAAGALSTTAGITAGTTLSAGTTVASTTTMTVGTDLTVTGNDISFGNGGTISNATNGAITLGEASEDLIGTFTSNTLTYTSSTALDTVDYGTIDLATDALDLSEGNITNAGSIALDSLSADGLTGVGITGGSIVDGGTDDYGIKVTQTLNCTEAAGGSDDYTAIDVAITSTDVTGYDTYNAINITDDATTVFNVTMAGDLQMLGSADDIGWTSAASANQACSATCAGTGNCVFGYDIGNTALVACDNADADSCICAGPAS
jgi:hypothetical protein